MSVHGPGDRYQSFEEIQALADCPTCGSMASGKWLERARAFGQEETVAKLIVAVEALSYSTEGEWRGIQQVLRLLQSGVLP